MPTPVTLASGQGMTIGEEGLETRQKGFFCSSEKEGHMEKEKMCGIMKIQKIGVVLYFYFC